MKFKPLIIWEKWQDPIINSLLPGEADTKDYTDEDEEYGSVYAEDDIVDSKSKVLYKYPVIMTPMGFVSYNEKTSCEKTFNFWVGHTNFTINKDVGDILEKSDGVETLDIFTRYRFRIGIAKAFKDSSVMRNINAEIYGYIDDTIRNK